MKFKRLIAIFVVFMLVGVMLGGCGNQADNQSKGEDGTSAANVETEASADEKIAEKITTEQWDWFGGEEGYPQEGKDLILPEMNKMLGFEVENKITGVGSYSDVTNKLQMWAASGMGEWPNIMMLQPDQTTMDIVNRLGEEGKLLNFMPMLDSKLSPVKELIKEPLSLLTHNGNAYALPQQWSDMKQFPLTPTVWIRKDWLDKVNLPIPRTVDEFENALRAFKENIKDENGNPVIPFECFGDLYSSGGFYQWPGGWFLPPDALDSDVNGLTWSFKDGEAYNFLVEDPKYEEYTINALKRFNKWFREGLIDKEAFIMKTGQMDEKCNAGRVGAICRYDYWAVNSCNDNLAQSDPNAMFVGLPDLYDPAVSSKPYVYNKFILAVWSIWVVRADTPQEEINAFLKYVNAAVDEDYVLLTWYGIKGNHWEFDADNKIINTADFENRSKGDYNKQTQEGLKWYFSVSNYDIIDKYMTVTPFEKRPDMIESWNNMGYKFPTVVDPNPNNYIMIGPTETKLTIGHTEAYNQMVSSSISAKNPDEIDAIVKNYIEMQRKVYDEIKKERTEACNKLDIKTLMSN